VALVRVYCGLASTPPAATQSSTSALLTVAVVDDAGRLLDVCDVGDDPSGYAELCALLAERSGGTAGLAVAADSDEHQVTLLLAAAGRPLAISDEESLDDYANRFGDEDSADELDAPVSVRRAVGLARALQAGALVAGTLSAPRELLVLKPVLSAHAALASGRQGAAVALREVLRELYPAALRAYPDPAEPIPLAILDALPEPGLLGTGAVNRGRDAAVATELSGAGLADQETISEAITALRVAIAETPRRAGIGKTLTTAVAESIRQSVAAVRACDAGIAALVGLLAEKAAPVSATGHGPLRTTGPAAPLRAIRESSSELPRVTRRARTAPPAPVTADPVPADALRTASAPRPVVQRTPLPRREDFSPAPSTHATPMTPTPSRGAPTPSHGAPTPSRGAPTPAAPAASLTPQAPASHAAPEQVNPPLGRPSGAPPAPVSTPPTFTAPPQVVSAPPSRAAGGPGSLSEPYPSGSYPFPAARPTPAPGSPAQPAPRPAPEVGPPGSRSDWPLNTSGTGLPMVEPIGRPTPNPLDPTSFPATTLPPTVLEQRASEPPPAPERRPNPPAIPRQRDGRVTPPWQADDLPAEPPALRLVEPAPLADRALRDDRPGMRDRDRDREYLGNPDRGATEQRGSASHRGPAVERPSGVEHGTPAEFNGAGRPGGDRTPGAAGPSHGERRLGAAAAFNRDTPGAAAPFNRDAPGTSAAFNRDAPGTSAAFNRDAPGTSAAFNREALGAAAAFNRDAPVDGANGAPLRLIEGEDPRGGRGRRSAEPISAPPVSDEPDGDLLIFAQARSAWFVGQLEPEDAAPDWANPADLGWQAAERAAQPVHGEETEVGLPRRVPQANLVPGSPLPPAVERPLRIVRDPASMAAHTTGYFRGSRRGEEVRGFAVGGRPGREAAGGWDFSRDGWEADRDEDRDYEYRSASNR
jgi:hypothetical protein